MNLFTASRLILVIFLSLAINSCCSVKAESGNAGSSGFLVVPNAYAGTPGTAIFVGPISNTPRTYQLLIHANELTQFVGRALLSLTFRLPTSATADWPAADAVFNNYDIYLSGSVDPANRSLTFAENIVGPQKQVRSGSMTIQQNSYRFGGSPNEFGDDITFDSAYIYTGGNLLIEIRQEGSNSNSRSVDAIGTAIPGYGTNFSACWQGSYTATTGLQGNFAVIRINGDIIQGIENEYGLPESFALFQNYPNPFNPATSISFAIPGSGHVTLRVIDINGRIVDTPVDREMTSGRYTIRFSAANLPSGIYYSELIMETEGKRFSDVKKMTLLK